MIYTTQDLKFFLKEDLKQFGNNKPGFRDWFLHNERWFIYRFKYELRHVEYYSTKKRAGGEFYSFYITSFSKG